ncbi:MAG TPA: hypothetical protein DCM28_22450 [Phycisphaerales bacterium]|nr:hypothetical protein [Phycisphaerales bacterium]HCD34104.1 hypothetical protein [Phycisphaerales bacterium]
MLLFFFLFFRGLLFGLLLLLLCLNLLLLLLFFFRVELFFSNDLFELDFLLVFKMLFDDHFGLLDFQQQFFGQLNEHLHLLLHGGDFIFVWLNLFGQLNRFAK